MVSALHGLTMGRKGVPRHLRCFPRAVLPSPLREGSVGPHVGGDAAHHLGPGEGVPGMPLHGAAVEELRILDWFDEHLKKGM
jgi:hypothetical protein